MCVCAVFFVQVNMYDSVLQVMHFRGTFSTLLESIRVAVLCGIPLQHCIHAFVQDLCVEKDFIKSCCDKVVSPVKGLIKMFVK